jgi:WD40 repeat protein
MTNQSRCLWISVAVLTAGAVRTSAQDARLRATFGGHTAVVTALGISPDGKTLATAGYDKSVKLWDIAAGKEALSIVGHGPMAMSADGNVLAFGGDNQMLHLWDIAARRERAALRPGYVLRRIAFTPDSKTLVTAGEGTIKLVDVAAGKERADFKLNMHKNNTNLVLGISLPADSSVLATAHGDGTIGLWDMSAGKERFLIPFQEARPHREAASVAFTSDGKMLACGFGDGTVKIVDVATGNDRVKVKAHAIRAWGVAFSPDNKLLASGGWDGLVKLWDVASGELRGQVVAHDDRVYTVAFTPDGSTLVSGGGVQFKRGEANLWDVAEILRSSGKKP